MNENFKKKPMSKNALPSIYYACSLPVRAGGEVVNYQHVAALRQLGYRAFVLLDPNSRVGIPTNPYSVPMVHWGGNLRFTQEDWLVVPEVFPPKSFAEFAKLQCQVVIHNQNPFYTFRGFQSIMELNAYPLAGGLCCSDYTRKTLAEWGSKTDWQVVRPRVLDAFNAPVGAGQRKKQIAFMPRKRAEDVKLLRSIFASMFPEHVDVPWVEINNKSRGEVAQILRESYVFISLSKNEGLGLPPLEAMASGCLVCGFHGGGGQEYATDLNGWWVSEGEWAQFARYLDMALTCSDAEVKRRTDAGKETAARFGEAQFVADLAKAWDRLLKGKDHKLRIAPLAERGVTADAT